MECPKCKTLNLDQAKFCKNCGFRIGSKITKLLIKKNFKWILLSIVIVTVLLIYSLWTFNNEYYYSDEDIILDFTDGQASTLEELDIYFDKNLKESVVNIFCSNEGDNISLDNVTTGGSGTMITSDGIILTNFHILFEGDYNRFISLDTVRCLVLLSEPEFGTPEEMYIARPLAIPDLNVKYDLVFLEIIDSFIDEEGEVYGDYLRDFSAYDNTVCLGKGNPELGERIRIFGYPAVSGGWSLTITDGLVSSFNDDGNIITSAKIDSGNSGGLAVDENDCIVGVTVAVSIGDYENLGEIISINNVNQFLLEFKERNELEQIFTNVKFK